ncbi:MAG TPA: peptidoglycan-binding protein [Candidatus Flavonifractor merdipullorum]|uniref:Peptidoglycan-binding protein n=1 Tax=Candidatus Flavonifractor merdipullorum TaxID=2838590 RepID=A0A9D1RVN7_9FIRM|nr:peptidoglycan-binding protein [Candidatus Flavonifractor merdipullorum]
MYSTPSNEILRQAQQACKAMAPLLAPLEDCPVNGRHCAATRRNLCRLQRMMGLPQTGEADEAMVRRLQRLNQLCQVCVKAHGPGYAVN